MNEKLHLERSWETDVLVETLLAVPVGETISYQQLSEACGQNVQGEARGKLVSALSILERDHSVLFDSVRAFGYQRCTPTGVVKKATGAIRRIHRSAKRGLVRTECISADERQQLEATDRLKLDTGKTILTQLARVTDNHSQKKISNGGEIKLALTLPKVS